ncbi:MAG: 3-deoxy-8-phosphooctulonate synthase [Candidatus Tectomicrobia bacterium]|uniref:3-deoxy-8-phosphooctulonate synthase n=1 Tax=Tectimicrobiota bacterium TaxID=2528274 RepID=A0A932GM80_UNCTE|nr:3-deoxy-8-phosphooctulonate synthase [Candidatus Tectomicrobia bacterium]
MSREVPVGSVILGGGNPLVLIAGPCVIESERDTLEIARRLKEITAAAGVPLIFKASYDKANRTSIRSFRGPGPERGLRVLMRVREDLGVPVLSDVHETDQVYEAGQVLDVLQIPAFLCRQTDLVVAAARTGKVVNAERGISFGYNNLVVDFRSLVIMAELGYPVVFDATHSVQIPAGAGTASGGNREFIAPLSRAAVAVGCDALFVEVHPDPDKALSDGPNSLKLEDLPDLLRQVKAIAAAR